MHWVQFKTLGASRRTAPPPPPLLLHPHDHTPTHTPLSQTIYTHTHTHNPPPNTLPQDTTTLPVHINNNSLPLHTRVPYAHPVPTPHTPPHPPSPLHTCVFLPHGEKLYWVQLQTPKLCEECPPPTHNPPPPQTLRHPRPFLHLPHGEELYWVQLHTPEPREEQHLHPGSLPLGSKLCCPLDQNPGSAPATLTPNTH